MRVLCPYRQCPKEQEKSLLQAHSYQNLSLLFQKRDDVGAFSGPAFSIRR